MMSYNVATEACFFFSQCSYGLLAIPMVSNVHCIGSRDIVIHFRIMSMNECGYDIFENVLKNCSKVLIYLTFLYFIFTVLLLVMQKEI